MKLAKFTVLSNIDPLDAEYEIFIDEYLSATEELLALRRRYHTCL